jgi:hypothetical protein
VSGDHRLLENRPMQHRVRHPFRVRRHAQPCTRGKLADHRLGHHRLGVIRLGARGKHRHSKRAHAGRQMSGRAQRVIPAAGERSSTIGAKNAIGA